MGSMHTHLLFSISIVISLSFAACAQSGVKSHDGIRSPDEILSRVLARAAEIGMKLPFEPSICEWTRPSLISWRSEKKCVAIPRWSETPPKVQELFGELASAPGNGSELFNELFRWFLIPHELAHAFQEVGQVRSDHAKSEQFANDLAVAYYVETGSGDRLSALEARLRYAAARLPLDVPAGEDPMEYFNKNYDRLTANPRRYGAFQFEFMLRSLAQRDSVDFAKLLRSL